MFGLWILINDFMVQLIKLQKNCLTNKCSLVVGGMFFVVDLVFYLTIHLYGYVSAHGGMPLEEESYVYFAVEIWNFVHMPTLSVFEPLLFPIITTDLVFQKGYLFVILDMLCLLQFTIIGFLVGLFLCRFAKKKGGVD